jgi:hypothetical protein
MTRWSGARLRGLTFPPAVHRRKIKARDQCWDLKKKFTKTFAKKKLWRLILSNYYSTHDFLKKNANFFPPKMGENRRKL